MFSRDLLIIRTIVAGLIATGLVLLGPAGVVHAQVSRSADVKQNRAFVYSGKLVRPDGSVPNGNIAVSLKIFSPDPSLCLLWSETQTVTVNNGGFSLELGHAVHRLSGSAGGAAADFKQVFINNASMTITGAQCASGTSYTPTSVDDRLLTAAFNDAGTVVEIANLPIKSVPYALQAEEIAGFGIANLAKISGAGSSVTFSPAEVQSLKDLLGGDIDWDMKSRKITKVADPVANDDAATKGWVSTAIATQMSGAGLGTVTNVSVGGLPLSVTNGSTTPVLSIAQANTTTAGYLSAADWNTFNGKQPAGAYLTAVAGHTLADGMTWMGNASNQAAVRLLRISDLRSSSGGGASAFLGASGSCPAGQSLQYISANDKLECAAFAITSAQVAAGLAPAVADAHKFYAVNATGDGMEFKTVSAGTGISLVPSAGGLQISATNSGTVQNVSVAGLPLSVGGSSASPQLSIAQANTTTAGYLSAADWNTFNGKQAAITPTAGDANKVYGANAAGNGNEFKTLTGAGTVSVSHSAGVITITGSGGGGGTVTGVSSVNADIGVANGSTSPSLTLNSGTAGGAGDANKIAKLDAGGLLAANMLPNHSAAKITSGTLAVAQGGTGSSTPLNNNRLMVSSGGNIVEAAAITANRALASSASGIPVATGVTDTELGYVSGVTSSLQTQLNGKQASNTELTGLAGIASTGIVQRTGAGAYTGLGTTAPLSVSGGNIVMSQAATGANGWLSSTDWNTFNGKQAALGYTPVNRGGDTMTGALALPSNGLAVGTNQLVVSGGNVGIGTASPAAKLDVAGLSRVSGAGATFLASGTGQVQLQLQNTAAGTDSKLSEIIEQAGSLSFRTVNDAYTNAQNYMEVTRNTNNFTINRVSFPNGNVGIGTTTPAAKLDVSGAVKGGYVDVGAGTTIDWSLGNVQTSTAGCSGTAFTMNNMVDGASYTLILKASSHSAACSFTGSGVSNYRQRPYPAKPAGYVVITVLKSGTDAFVSWVDSY